MHRSVKPALLPGILILAAALRLLHIQAPVIGWQSWRQADTAAMARNFAEEDRRFGYPRVDWRGDGPGYVESEFPVYTYTVSVLYRAVGTLEWPARMLSILFSLAGIIYLVRLTRILYSERAALWAGFFLAVLPNAVFYSRSIQPESLMLLAMTAGIYHFLVWCRTDRPLHGAVSWVFIALACLIKPPMLYVGLVLAYLALHGQGGAWLKKLRYPLYALTLFGALTLWYWHAHRLYMETGLTFGIWSLTDKMTTTNLLLSLPYWFKVLIYRPGDIHLTWAGFIILIIGLMLKPGRPLGRLPAVWLLGFVIYLALVAGGNDVHDYYQLSMLIPSVMVLGMVYAEHAGFRSGRSMKSIILFVALAAILGQSGFKIGERLIKENPETSLEMMLASEISRVTDPGDLVITVDRGDPTLLYLADRKGWQAMPGQVFHPSFLQKRTGRGARWLAGLYRDFDTPDLRQKLDELMQRHDREGVTDDRFFILKLVPPEEKDHG